ncbi:Nicotinamide mononucleotide adenylyltransferase [Cladobotryum mycophilum]|uniref:Nicotinamide mononucleotide adenylyltransferase n=1 Tax=Cladobotryum mycophilum TaxID=491253 RepID=A0ABR0SZX0_9HYPO
MTSTEPHPEMRHNPKHLLEFFSRSLTSFQSSQDVFRVLCTLPHHQEDQTAAPAPRKPNGSSPVKKLLVLDSSFNPPTRAHAQMARSALKWAGSSGGGGGGGARVMLLLAVNNADKAPKPASFPVRLGMMDGFGRSLLEGLRGEVQGQVQVQIDLAVTKMPYFHDKARAISESGFYGYDFTRDGGELEQVFLVGFDTVIRIFNPKYYGSPEGDREAGMRAALGPFFERARLRVTMRPDDEWGDKGEQEDYVKGLEDGALEGVGGIKRGRGGLI